jgi:DNA processing protein
MACESCLRRSALVAALAPTISSLSLNRQGLFDLLALPNGGLLRAAKVSDSRLPRIQGRDAGTAICRHDPEYPETFRQLPCPPAVLYATCTPERLCELRAKPTVAILGGREYSAHVRHPTFELARELAGAGVTVISGLDRGLEGIAQHGAFHARAPAIAVTATAPQRPYTPDHADLHQRILARGAIVSELPPAFHHPERWLFVAAQRIIAALSRVLVLVQAGGYSCARLTINIGTALGQEVAVFPSRVTDPGGAHMFQLLRDGAHPVSCAGDVLGLL